MKFLIDYNLTGDAVLFWGTLSAEGWLDLLSIKFFTFKEVGLPNRFDESSYRQKCATRLIEILIDLENYRGAGRVFIP
jgi:hypothetical protein